MIASRFARACVCLVFVSACSGTDNSSPSSTGTTEKGSPAAGSSGGCTGPISECALGSLSEAQYRDYCDIYLSAVSDPPGTRYECKSGINEGAYLTLSTKEQCLSYKPPSSCKVTGNQQTACFKAASKDPCTALTPNGACGSLLDEATAKACAPSR